MVTGSGLDWRLDLSSLYASFPGTAFRTWRLQSPGFNPELTSRHGWQFITCSVVPGAASLHHELVVSLENSRLTPSDNTQRLAVFPNARLSFCARAACPGHAGLSAEDCPPAATLLLLTSCSFKPTSDSKHSLSTENIKNRPQLSPAALPHVHITQLQTPATPQSGHYLDYSGATDLHPTL